MVGGIVKRVQAKVVLVPFWDRLSGVLCRIFDGLCKRFVTERTVAIYINTPNNPTGLALSLEQMQALVQFSRYHNLAIWADEVYERITFDTDHHVSAVSLAPEKTVGIYSFSKQYGMAGNRCGYLIFPSSEIMEEVRKAFNNCFYSTPTLSQIAAVKAIEHGESWLESAVESYKDTGYQMAEIFGVPKPQGSTFCSWMSRNIWTKKGSTAYY